jgi:hypothetical protein
MLQCSKLRTKYPLEMIWTSMSSFEAIFFSQKTGKYHALNLKVLAYYVNFIQASLYTMTYFNIASNSWIFLSHYNSSWKQILEIFHILDLLTRCRHSWNQSSSNPWVLETVLPKQQHPHYGQSSVSVTFSSSFYPSLMGHIHFTLYKNNLICQKYIQFTNTVLVTFKYKHSYIPISDLFW